MPVAWFLYPYKRRDVGGRQGRYPGIDDYTTQILADPEYAGAQPWSETEVLGGHCIVKVRASATLLTTINAEVGVQRIPARFTDLSMTLGDLTAGERTALLNKMQALGYTTAEITTALGGTLAAWRTVTLAQLLGFIATRRLRPRYDVPTATIILDGQVEACVPIETVNTSVA